jgi:hypothetical protein
VTSPADRQQETTVSDYDQMVQRIEARIHRNHMLQEAQIPDSAHAIRYQTRIAALTDALHQVEQAVPRLQELDRQIANAELDLDDAFTAAQRGSEPWPQVAMWTGGFGGAGLLAGLGLGLPWQVMVLSGLALLASAGCVAMTVRWRRTANGDLQYAQDVLAELQQARSELMPTAAMTLIEESV